MDTPIAMIHRLLHKEQSFFIFIYLFIKSNQQSNVIISIIVENQHCKLIKMYRYRPSLGIYIVKDIETWTIICEKV